MSGPRTSAFLLGAATVMLGAIGQTWSLNPAVNSIGLVKNVKVETAPGFINLESAGKNSSPIYSVRGNANCKASFEAYEYTSANVAYSLGLDPAAQATNITRYAMAAPPQTGDINAFVLSSSYVQHEFVQGAWVAIAEPGTDRVHIAQLTSPSTYATADGVVITTLRFQNQPIAPNSGFTNNATISIVNALEIGSSDVDPLFSAKIVGVLPDGNTPLGMVFPKVRITKGFGMDWGGQRYSTMGFEFTPLQPLPGEPDYDVFRDMMGLLFAPSFDFVPSSIIPSQPVAPPIIARPQYIYLRNGARLVVRPCNPLTARL